MTDTVLSPEQIDREDPSTWTEQRVHMPSRRHVEVAEEEEARLREAQEARLAEASS
jgi:hypothetical protein